MQRSGAEVEAFSDKKENKKKTSKTNNPTTSSILIPIA